MSALRSICECCGSACEDCECPIPPWRMRELEIEKEGTMIDYSKYVRPEDMTRLMLIATVKRLMADLDRISNGQIDTVLLAPSREATAEQAGAPDAKPYDQAPKPLSSP